VRRFTDLEVHPTNNKIIYRYSWRRMEKVTTVEPLLIQYLMNIFNLLAVLQLILQNQTKHLVGTGETWTRNSVSMGDGIYKSTDGGQNWKNMGLPKSDRISSIIVDPKNSDIVWVGVLGALWEIVNERGVYKTTDGEPLGTNR
jgi:hypothetical protein